MDSVTKRKKKRFSSESNTRSGRFDPSHSLNALDTSNGTGSTGPGFQKRKKKKPKPEEEAEDDEMKIVKCKTNKGKMFDSEANDCNEAINKRGRPLSKQLIVSTPEPVYGGPVLPFGRVLPRVLPRSAPYFSSCWPVLSDSDRFTEFFYPVSCYGWGARYRCPFFLERDRDEFVSSLSLYRVFLAFLGP